MLRGGFCNAGEVGMAFPSGTPRPSYKDLLATLDREGFTENQLPELIAEQHPLLESWFERCRGQVEQTVFGCVQWVDPQIIVLGGDAKTDYQPTGGGAEPAARNSFRS